MKRSKVNATTTLAVLAVLALVAAGCSSSAKASAPKPEPTTTTAAAPGTKVVTQSSQPQVLTEHRDGHVTVRDRGPDPGVAGRSRRGRRRIASFREQDQRGRVRARCSRHGEAAEPHRGAVQRIAGPDRASLERSRRSTRRSPPRSRRATCSRRCTCRASARTTPTSVSPARSTRQRRPSCSTTERRPDSKIVGLSYLVWHPGGRPRGSPGPNDHWHQHNANGGLCIARRNGRRR